MGPGLLGLVDLGHDLLGGIAQIVCRDDREARIGEDFLALLDIGAFEACTALASLNLRLCKQLTGKTKEISKSPWCIGQEDFEKHTQNKIDLCTDWLLVTPP